MKQLSNGTFVAGYTGRELYQLRKTASSADRAVIDAERARRVALYGTDMA